MTDLEDRCAVLVVGEVDKEAAKADCAEDDIPVDNVGEREDGADTVRSQGEAWRLLGHGVGDNGAENKKCKHDDGDNGWHLRG